MRNLCAALAGALFGTGLLVSGMTDTKKVQGWLDVFGAWDPTLAFVMGGAIVPMSVAWVLTTGRRPLLGGAFPDRSAPKLEHNLVSGSVLFGMGRGLVGLCPGPALASLGFGGWPVLIFTLAMLGGMVLAPAARTRLDAATAAA